MHPKPLENFHPENPFRNLGYEIRAELETQKYPQNSQLRNPCRIRDPKIPTETRRQPMGFNGFTGNSLAINWDSYWDFCRVIRVRSLTIETQGFYGFCTSGGKENSTTFWSFERGLSPTKRSRNLSRFPLFYLRKMSLHYL